MLNDLLEKGLIQLLKPKRPEEVGMTAGPLYYWYQGWLVTRLKNASCLECIMRLVKDGMIILNLDDIVESNHISCQIKGLSLIQLGSLEPTVLHERGLLSPAMQEGFS